MKFTFVSFSGHRDCNVPEEELARIADEFPGATWVHGAAEGFDTQVDRYAKNHGVRAYAIPAKYQGYPDYDAPNIRNCIIVNAAPVLVVCYDGRDKGGTLNAIKFAGSLGKRIIRLTAQEIVRATPPPPPKFILRGTEDSQVGA